MSDVLQTGKKIFTDSQGRVRSGWGVFTALAAYMAFTGVNSTYIEPLRTTLNGVLPVLPTTFIITLPMLVFFYALYWILFKFLLKDVHIGGMDFFRPGRRGLVLFFAGAGLAVLIKSIDALFNIFFNGASYRFNELDVSWLLAGILFFLIRAAVSEELCFRGFMQHSLQRRLGMWPAALITSIVFAALHLINPGMDAWTQLIIFSISMMIAGLFLSTKSIMFVIGLHTFWDWMEDYIFADNPNGLFVLSPRDIEGRFGGNVMNMWSIFFPLAIFFALFFIGKKRGWFAADGKKDKV